MQRSEKLLYLLMVLLITLLFITAMALEGPLEVVGQVVSLQRESARLINDFTLYGVGTALFNAATVGTLGLVLVYFATVSLSGPTLSAIVTMMGFAFFGNTLLNCTPLILGVWLASKLARKTFGSYSLIALFGTALGPLVTYVMFSLGLPYALSIPLGLVSGVAAGFILPAVAGSMLQLHQGYNLYNVGFSCGFIGLFAANLLLASNKMQAITIAWNTAYSLSLTLLVPVFSLALIITAIVVDKPKRSMQGLLAIQKLSGRLPYDFFDTGSITARIDGQFSGNSIDDLIGTLVVDSTSLVEESFVFNPGPIYLQSEVEEGEKTIRMFSNFLEAEIIGDYYFTSIAQEFTQLLQPHLSTLLDSTSTKVDYKNDFNFDVTIKNTEDLSYVMSLPFFNIEPGTIKGRIDMPKRKSTINLAVPRLMFGANDVRQTKVDVSITEESGVDLDVITYLVQDDGYINGKLDTQVFQDSVTNELFFDMNNNVIKSNGVLWASVGFDKNEEQNLVTNIFIHPTTLRFNQKDVHIKESSIMNTGEFIKVSNFGIVHEGKQQFGIYDSGAPGRAVGPLKVLE